MALIDTSFLLLDPDFTSEPVALITRASAVNEWGEHVVDESAPQPIVAAVQPASSEDLQKLPEGARLADAIDVWYRGVLAVERPDGYADIILWRGQRFIVKSVDDWMMNGTGYCKAICVLEELHA